MLEREIFVEIFKFLSRRQICGIQLAAFALNELIKTHFNNKPPFQLLKRIEIFSNELWVRTFEPIDNDMTKHKRLWKYYHKFDGLMSETTLMASNLLAQYLRALQTSIFLNAYNKDSFQLLNKLHHIWDGFKVEFVLENFLSPSSGLSLNEFNNLMQNCTRLHCILSCLPTSCNLVDLQCNSIGVRTFAENFPFENLLEWLKSGHQNKEEFSWMKEANAKFVYLDSCGRFDYRHIRKIIYEDFFRPTAASEHVLLPFVIEFGGVPKDFYNKEMRFIKKISENFVTDEILFEYKYYKLKDYYAAIGRMRKSDNVEQIIGNLIEEIENARRLPE